MHQHHHHHRHHHHSSHKEKRGFFSRIWHKLCSIWPWYKSLYKGRAWYIKLIVGLISFILLFVIYLGMVDINFLWLFGKSPGYFSGIRDPQTSEASVIYSADGKEIGKYFNENRNVDVIIVARGGGSYEELFCFNDEGIARAVYASKIPVISAIGHEPDYTIIDYVADVRAATPTAAGEMVIASYADQTKEIDNLALNLDIAINQFIDSRRKALDVYKNHKALHSPAFYAREQLAVVNGLKNQLDALSSRFVKQAQSEVNEVKVRLDALNPNNVLNRGYSYVCNSKGKAVESAKSVKKGDNVSIVLSDGTLLTEIKDISIKTDGGSKDA